MTNKCADEVDKICSPNTKTCYKCENYENYAVLCDYTWFRRKCKETCGLCPVGNKRKPIHALSICNIVAIALKCVDILAFLCYDI